MFICLHTFHVFMYLKLWIKMNDLKVFMYIKINECIQVYTCIYVCFLVFKSYMHKCINMYNMNLHIFNIYLKMFIIYMGKYVCLTNLQDSINS